LPPRGTKSTSQHGGSEATDGGPERRKKPFQIKRPAVLLLFFEGVAEREGFEPTVRFALVFNPLTSRAGMADRTARSSSFSFYPALSVSTIERLAHFPYGSLLRIFGCMKQAENTTGTEPGNSGASRTVAMGSLDPELVKFVETLAIADAKRDHFALSGPASKRIPDAAGSRAGSSTNDTRSHLRTIFDRASERKID
jgi:hypothetical protein